MSILAFNITINMINVSNGEVKSIPGQLKMMMTINALSLVLMAEEFLCRVGVNLEKPPCALRIGPWEWREELRPEAASLSY